MSSLARRIELGKRRPGRVVGKSGGVRLAPRFRWPAEGAHTSWPAINGRTGKPHTHAREIARRLRQAKRDG